MSGKQRQADRARTLRVLHDAEQTVAHCQQRAREVRRTIRRYQHKRDAYAWQLELGLRQWEHEDQVTRAIRQLDQMIDRALRDLDEADGYVGRAQSRLRETQVRLEKSTCWDRWAARFDEWFWPVTILRAIWFGRATRNA